MENTNDVKAHDNTSAIGPDDGIRMDAEARAYLNELSADEDAAREDWADDEECVDREAGIDPDEDLPEMEILMNNIYVM